MDLNHGDWPSLPFHRHHMVFTNLACPGPSLSHTLNVDMIFHSLEQPEAMGAYRQFVTRTSIFRLSFWYVQRIRGHSIAACVRLCMGVVYIATPWQKMKVEQRGKSPASIDCQIAPTASMLFTTEFYLHKMSFAFQWNYPLTWGRQLIEEHLLILKFSDELKI